MGGVFYVNSFDVFSTIFDYEKCFMRPLELFKTSSADWLGSMFVPKTGVAHFTSLFSIEPMFFQSPLCLTVPLNLSKPFPPENHLEGIIKVSVVATGINRNENQDYFENKTNRDQPLSVEENLDFKTDEHKEQTKTISVDDHIEILQENNIDQIDLESEINRLDVKKENDFIKDINDTKLNINNEELKSIFENKPDNQFTQPKPKSLLKRVSSFFGKDKMSEIKLDPNLKLQKDVIAEKEIEETNNKLKFDSEDPKSQKNQINETRLNLTQKVELPENKTDTFDLFNDKNQNITNNHQIDLTEIEQENKDIDEKVLEIPAFLRRQAN